MVKSIIKWLLIAAIVYFVCWGGILVLFVLMHYQDPRLFLPVFHLSDELYGCVITKDSTSWSEGKIILTANGKTATLEGPMYAKGGHFFRKVEVGDTVKKNIGDGIMTIISKSGVKYVDSFGYTILPPP